MKIRSQMMNYRENRTYQMLTHTSLSSGQMEVMSQSTLQIPLPRHVVACKSQNLHSCFIAIMEVSEMRVGKRKRMEKVGLVTRWYENNKWQQHSCFTKKESSENKNDIRLRVDLFKRARRKSKIFHRREADTFFQDLCWSCSDLTLPAGTFRSVRQTGLCDERLRAW